MTQYNHIQTFKSLSDTDWSPGQVLSKCYLRTQSLSKLVEESFCTEVGMYYTCYKGFEGLYSNTHHCWIYKWCLGHNLSKLWCTVSWLGGHGCIQHRPASAGVSTEIWNFNLLSWVSLQDRSLRGYCTPGPYFWRLCAFSQKIKQLRTKYPMHLVRNVPRNSKITVLLQ